MPLMPVPPTQGHDSYAKDKQAIWREINALWRKLQQDAQKGTNLVYVQDDEPTDVPVGTLWYDTDAGV